MEVESFEVSGAEVVGDLLSPNRIQSCRPLKIGFMATGFFEYWRMYPETLKASVEADMQVVADRLSRRYDLVCSGLVDTMDSADAAGRRFKDEQIDLLILTECTYTPDYIVNQALGHIPEVPLLIYVSQAHDRVDLDSDYEETLRNSGMMALVQLVAGFRKMGTYPHLEVVAGSIHEDEVYRRIDEYIQVVTIYKQLKSMTIGVVGHVFRGMFDFEYDKTMIKGKLGPHVMNIQIGHLLDLWEQTSPEDRSVRTLVERVNGDYEVKGLDQGDIAKAARFAVALRKLVERFRLDAIALLGQHYVEAKTKTTSYLGVAELLNEGRVMAVTEGDVPGLIMMKIMRHLAGRTPFFGEWGEFDVPRNAMLIMGHGYMAPDEAKKGLPIRVRPTPEQWGYEGHGFSFELTMDPGPATMGHIVNDVHGWRMLISGGEIMDIDPLPCGECTVLVEVEKPIKEYVEQLVKSGFPHHCILVSGDIRRQLAQLADLMGVEKVFL